MSDSEEKTLPPSPRKLRDARRRGEVARSKELVTASATAAGLLGLALTTPHALSLIAGIVGDTTVLQDQPFAEAAASLVRRLSWPASLLVVPPLLLVVVTTTIAGVLSSGGLVVSMDPITPKFDRLNPIQGFSRLVSIRSLVELLKTLVKLVAVIAVCFLVLRTRIGDLLLVPGCGLRCVPGVVVNCVVPLLAACCLVFMLIGLLDVGLQRWLFRRDMRMTHSEHKRDRKDAEGDPHLLAHRKKERREIAQLGAKTGIKYATFAVQCPDRILAFRYAPPATGVPILVARRSGQACLQLVKEARGYGVPIVWDPEAMDALGTSMMIGRMIPKSAFGAVIRCMRAAGVL